MAEQLPNIPPYILQSEEIQVISSLQEGTLLNFAESGVASANRLQPLSAPLRLSRNDVTESDYYDYEAVSP
jgi:hypothetical protein